MSRRRRCSLKMTENVTLTAPFIHAIYDLQARIADLQTGSALDEKIAADYEAYLEVLRSGRVPKYSDTPNAPAFESNDNTPFEFWELERELREINEISESLAAA